LQAVSRLKRQGYLQVGRLPQQAAYNFALLDPRLNFGVANLLKRIDITLVVFLNLFEGIERVKFLGHPILPFLKHRVSLFAYLFVAWVFAQVDLAGVALEVKT